jgi:hypothetical protein
LRDADVAMLNKLVLTRELLFGAPRLKLVALAATGTNNVDLIAARECGIAVCNGRSLARAGRLGACRVFGQDRLLISLRDQPRAALFSFFAARFSSSVLVGFFLSSFFRSIPLPMIRSSWLRSMINLSRGGAPIS